MQTLQRNPFGASPRRLRRLSASVLVGALISVVVLFVGSVILLLPPLRSHAAKDNTDCALIVPAHPLTARGLATPYQLMATDPASGPCNESKTDQSAFVQGVIYDRTTGTFSVYNPLVIDKGTQPAVLPRVPTLPRGAIVGIWFGFNANNLLLQGAQRNTLAQAHCVNGLGHSLFTKFAYCNAPTFFAAVKRGVTAHRVYIPPLQTAKDGKPCPTVRDFSIVDQSGNVQTQYLATANGQTAQFSAANKALLQNATTIANPSDNRLLTDFIDPALGCQAWQAPNLADNNSPVAALALDEVQAVADQHPPIALVPLTDPMTTVANNPSLVKTNLYRRGIDQIPAANDQQASGTTYCQNLVQTGMPRLELDQPLTINAPTPDTGAAKNLFTFVAQRFQASYTMLNCPQLLNMPNPVTTQTDTNGVVISATFNGQGSNPPTSTASATPIPSPSATVGGQATSTPVPTTNATPIPSPSATVGGQATSTPVPTTSATATVQPVGQSSGWNLVFNDEFNGTTVDTTKWTPNWFGSSNTTITKSVNSLETDCVDPNQSSVGNGELDITAKAQPCTVNGTTYPYRSGLLQSNGKFSFTYGYMEARIWQPAGTGMWPAFWSDGQNWPQDGEIDVLEGDGTGNSSYHYHYLGGGPGGGVNVPDATSGWHTYAVDWEPGVITWYYDGQQVWQYTTGITSSPQYVIVQLALSSNQSAVPAMMRVKYVRVWKKA